MEILLVLLVALVVVGLLGRPRYRVTVHQEPDYVAPERVAESHFIAINEHIQPAQAAPTQAIRRYHAEKAQA